MGTSYSGRLGTTPEEGLKAPCVVASTSNITLSGAQTISSIAVVAGDRVLVAGQTDSTENGIYDAASGAWTRSTDWNDANDVVSGQLVFAPSVLYTATFTGSFSVGTTNVTFSNLISTTLKTTLYIDVRDHGAVADGLTSSASANVTAFAAAIAAAITAGSNTIYAPGGASWYELNDRILITTDDITILGDSGTHLKWSSMGSARTGVGGINPTDGIRVEASNFTLKSVKLQGPSVATYVGSENLITCMGTATSLRESGFVFEECEFYDSGSAGLFFFFCNNGTVNNCTFHDLGHIGLGGNSCINMTVKNNLVYTITPGVSSQMYGMTWSHLSTGYDDDTAVSAGTQKLAANPFCQSIKVLHNKVWDVSWEGIDFHGGWECIIDGNEVYNTGKGIALSGSSGDAILYAGGGNRVVNNIVDGANENGTTSGREWQDYGINIAGGDTFRNRNVTCTGNIISNKGIEDNSLSASIQATNVLNCVISDNHIQSWMGVGIYTAAGDALNIHDNTFSAKGWAGTAGDSASMCIRDATTGTSNLTLTGNVLELNGGIAPAEGARFNLLTDKVFLSGNDFSQATTEYVAPGNGVVEGLDRMPVIYAGVSDTTPSVQLSAASECILYFNPTGGSVTVTNLDDGVFGQMVTLYNVHASNTVTFDRTTAALDGGANWVGGRRDTLKVFWDGSLWIEVGRAANS